MIVTPAGPTEHGASHVASDPQHSHSQDPRFQKTKSMSALSGPGTSSSSGKLTHALVGTALEGQPRPVRWLDDLPPNITVPPFPTAAPGASTSGTMDSTTAAVPAKRRGRPAGSGTKANKKLQALERANALQAYDGQSQPAGRKGTTRGAGGTVSASLPKPDRRRALIGSSDGSGDDGDAVATVAAGAPAVSLLVKRGGSGGGSSSGGGDGGSPQRQLTGRLRRYIAAAPTPPAPADGCQSSPSAKERPAAPSHLRNGKVSPADAEAAVWTALLKQTAQLAGKKQGPGGDAGSGGERCAADSKYPSSTGAAGGRSGASPAPTFDPAASHPGVPSSCDAPVQRRVFGARRVASSARTVPPSLPSGGPGGTSAAAAALPVEGVPASGTSPGAAAAAAARTAAAVAPLAEGVPAAALLSGPPLLQMPRTSELAVSPTNGAASTTTSYCVPPAVPPSLLSAVEHCPFTSREDCAVAMQPPFALSLELPVLLPPCSHPGNGSESPSTPTLTLGPSATSTPHHQRSQSHESTVVVLGDAVGWRPASSERRPGSIRTLQAASSNSLTGLSASDRVNPLGSSQLTELLAKRSASAPAFGSPSRLIEDGVRGEWSPIPHPVLQPMAAAATVANGSSSAAPDRASAASTNGRAALSGSPACPATIPPASAVKTNFTGGSSVQRVVLSAKAVPIDAFVEPAPPELVVVSPPHGGDACALALGSFPLATDVPPASLQASTSAPARPADPAAAAASEAEFVAALEGLTGAGTSVKGTAAKALACAGVVGAKKVMRAVMERLGRLTDQINTRAGLGGAGTADAELIGRRLHLVYLVDSIVQRCIKEGTNDHCRDFPRLLAAAAPDLVRKTVTNAANFDKVRRVMGIWESKSILDSKTMRLAWECLADKQKQFRPGEPLVSQAGDAAAIASAAAFAAAAPTSATTMAGGSYTAMAPGGGTAGLTLEAAAAAARAAAVLRGAGFGALARLGGRAPGHRVCLALPEARMSNAMGPRSVAAWLDNPYGSLAFKPGMDDQESARAFSRTHGGLSLRLRHFVEDLSTMDEGTTCWPGTTWGRMAQAAGYSAPEPGTRDCRDAAQRRSSAAAAAAAAGPSAAGAAKSPAVDAHIAAAAQDAVQRVVAAAASAVQTDALDVRLGGGLGSADGLQGDGGGFGSGCLAVEDDDDGVVQEEDTWSYEDYSQQQQQQQQAPPPVAGFSGYGRDEVTLADMPAAPLRPGTAQSSHGGRDSMYDSEQDDDVDGYGFNSAFSTHINQPPPPPLPSESPPPLPSSASSLTHPQSMQFVNAQSYQRHQYECLLQQSLQHVPQSLQHVPQQGVGHSVPLSQHLGHQQQLVGQYMTLYPMGGQQQQQQHNVIELAQHGSGTANGGVSLASVASLGSGYSHRTQGAFNGASSFAQGGGMIGASMPFPTYALASGGTGVPPLSHHHQPYMALSHHRPHLPDSPPPPLPRTPSFFGSPPPLPDEDKPPLPDEDMPPLPYDNDYGGVGSAPLPPMPPPAPPPLPWSSPGIIDTW